MWLRGLTAVAHGVAQLAFPNSCLICDAPETDSIGFRHGLCIDCYLSVTTDPHAACPRCAQTTGPYGDAMGGCSRCRNESVGFQSALRLGPYEHRLRDAVIRAKGAFGENLAEMMGRVFWETACPTLSNRGVDLVVPVPLHWRRRWVRGFNQAASVAREIAAGLGIEFAPGALMRVRHTPQQLQPSASARRENVRGAFRVPPGASVERKRILLVDDVMTTGATAGEAARMLREAGAEWVMAAILARR